MIDYRVDVENEKVVGDKIYYHTYTEYCIDCDYSKELSTAHITEHDLPVAYGAEEATCEKSGFMAGLKCGSENCEYKYFEPTVIPAKGHTMKADSWVEEKGSTCTEQGYLAHGTCEWCGCAVNSDCIKIENIYLPLSNHMLARSSDGSTVEINPETIYNLSDYPEFVAGCIGVPPSDTTVGQSYFCCDTCGEIVFVQVIGHHFETKYDNTNHWSQCTVPGCSTIKGIEEHQFGENGCDICGFEGNYSSGLIYTRDGDYIYFGTYPQSEVTDEILTTALSAQAGSLPSASNPANWTSYGYYISSTVTDFMWYIDLTYGGEQYRGVYFTSYRPCFTGYLSSTDYSYQDNNGYSVSTVYWFKYEPIKWRILSEEGGEALILCEMIIDSQEYYDNSSTRTINGSTVYANNYAYSNIRTFLNETFYNTAFTSLQKELILLTEVDNSARSTNPDNDSTYYNSGTNTYACENTSDYIFLLSVQEVTKSAYGFSTMVSDYDSVRQKKTTDYAQCQGAYTCTDSSYEGNGWWWLRSPLYNHSNLARDVYYYGNANYDLSVDGTSRGIVPALKIKFTDCKENDHSVGVDCICTKCGDIVHDLVSHSAKDATCTEKGWETYQTCSRCDYTTYSEIQALGGDHDYQQGTCSKCSVTSYIRDGDYIYFGTYPQSEVTDESLITALSAQAGSSPTASNSANWTSYKYLISSTAKDYMWYIDISYNGNRYRSVYFTSYRPCWTDGASSIDNSNQDDNGYSISTVYWFSYDPIKWRILTENEGEALILCEMIIDSSEYYNSYANRNVEGNTVYANNYAYSNIRTFLNDNFYNTAFASLQKELILLTEVDNSERSTNLDNNSTYYNGGTNDYACANTNDYVFLLSIQEVTRASYGFNTSTSSGGSIRVKQMTAYARSLGGYVSGDNGWLWLRSADSNYYYNVHVVHYDGTVNGTSSVHYTGGGIVPSLRIKLSDCKKNGHTPDSNCICTKCGDTVHDLINHSAQAPTCTEKGWDAYQTCSRCDYSTYKEIPALGHDYVDCICSRCSKEYHIQDEKFCRHTNYIYFGTYPQSEVTDDNLTSILTAQAGSLPTENNSANWTSYGYYLEGEVTDYMWYIDLIYGGERYRGVYFTSYRPSYTMNDSSANNTNQDDNGYSLFKVYWFKYEPIKWSILTVIEGEAIVLCDMIIDSQEYYSSKESRITNGKTVHPNNYVYSNIRGWLNETFYNSAFTTLQKELIILTAVDNTERSSNPNDSAKEFNDGLNPYACENAQDNIFLLSVQEVTKSIYGFSSNYELNDSFRQKKLTAYAQSQGAYTCVDDGILGNGWWWLRSPYYESDGRMCGVYPNGYAFGNGAVYNSRNGVVPALRIKLTDCKENGHNVGSDCICSKCGDTVHTSTESLKCSVCGAATTYYRSGDYIYFGTYPQSEATDTTLLSTLTSKAGTLPTASNPANWTSYGYYISSTVTDFMWYIDLTYGGEQYRGVYFTSYRPYYTNRPGSADYSNQDDNGYFTLTVYWFKYESIKWRISSESNGEALILCEMIIDSQEYYDNCIDRTINGSTVYANNYAYSNIRSFLNETFYNTAFTTLQKELILLTTIDNSERSTNPDNDSTYYNGGENIFACSNTNDYIFLLSEQEITKSAYGFRTSVSNYDSLKQKKTTAYAQCQGAYTSTSSSYKGNGWWWLRSPVYNYSQHARYVCDGGAADDYYHVDYTRGGVVPALIIKLN